MLNEMCHSVEMLRIVAAAGPYGYTAVFSGSGCAAVHYPES